MKSLNLPLDTERLSLRPFAADDIDAIAAYHTLPEVQRYLDWKARDIDECRAALEVLRHQVVLHRPGDTLALAVARKADQQVIGHVLLRWQDATAGQAELRFVFNPAFRRQGYGAEAVRAIIDHGFKAFKFHRIFARCDARNHASARMMQRIGMRLEAHFREHALFEGEWDEELLFAVLDREWSRSAKVVELGAAKPSGITVASSWA